MKRITRLWRVLTVGLFAAASAASAQSPPTLSLAPHHSAFRDVSQGSATASYTTPAYVSLDQPRSVALTYIQAQARPTGFVQVDASDHSAAPPQRMSIQVRHLDGTPVTFTNGVQEIFYQAGFGTTRLAAQFDASGLLSRAYSFDVIVRSYWADGTLREAAPLRVRVPLVNERDSPFGFGWSMPGLQRLYNQGDGVYITQGDGTGLWFAQNASGGYDSPEGDFTTVFWEAPSGVWVRRSLDGSVVRFGWDGRMLDAWDRFGNGTAYAYDGAGRLHAITDPVGKSITFGYTAEGVLASIQDPTGRTVNTTTGGPGGQYVYRFWDPDGVLGLDLGFHTTLEELQTVWPRGADRNVAATGWEYAYDPEMRRHLVSITAPQVYTTDASWTRPTTTLRSLEQAVLPAPGKGTSASPADRIQPQNVRVEVTDPKGNTTRMAVDRFGLPTRIEEPLGRITTIERNGNGLVTRSVAPSGHTVWNTWNGMDLTQTYDETTGAVINATYGPYQQPDHIWGSTTEVWNYLNAQGLPDSTRVGSTTRPVTRYSYDGRGRVKSATDPEGHGTFLTYGDEYGSNAWANLHSAQTGVNTPRTTTYRYDNRGRVEMVRDPANDTTRIEYDLLNRVRKRVNSQGQAINYEYGAVHLDRVTDPKGQMYTFNHNALGWLESEVDPRNQWMYYGYDRNGNQTTYVNRRGQTITADYDALDRVRWREADGVRTDWSYGTHAESDRWVQVQNAASTDRIDFDPAGRPTQSRTTRGGTTYTLQSSYNERSLRTEVRLTSPWTSSVGYEYNPRMQLEALTDRMGGRTVLTYNDDGQEIRRTLPTGLQIYRDYPSTHITAQIRYSNPALQEALGVGYSHNPKGLIGARKERYNTGFEAGDLVREYGYDKVARLTGFVEREYPDGSGNCSGTAVMDPDGGVCVPSGGIASGGQSYSYDVVGNPQGTGTTVEPGNRLVQFNGYALEYDQDGNLIRKFKPYVVNQTLTWNSLGQLVQTTTNGTTVSYGYDGFGRWAQYTDQHGTIQYIWDGDDLFLEQNAAGAVTEYAYYPGVDEPHSLKRGTSIHYYTTEYPGNVVGLIGSQNELANEYEYSPFGEREYVRESVGNALQFQARHYDPASGLYAWRARWYDPTLRRFISEDPIGLEGGINPYVFAENSPVNFTDPFGLQTCGWQQVKVEHTVGGSFGGVDVGMASGTHMEWRLVCSGGHGSGRSGMGSEGRGGSNLPPNDLALGTPLIDPMIFFGGGIAKGGAKFAWDRAGHVFSFKAGHVNPATLASRQRFARLFEAVANNPSNLRSSGLPTAAMRAGEQLYTQTFQHGQVWVRVYQGVIKSAGVNRPGGYR